MMALRMAVNNLAADTVRVQFVNGEIVERSYRLDGTSLGTINIVEDPTWMARLDGVGGEDAVRDALKEQIPAWNPLAIGMLA